MATALRLCAALAEDFPFEVGDPEFPLGAHHSGHVAFDRGDWFSEPQDVALELFDSAFEFTANLGKVLFRRHVIANEFQQFMNLTFLFRRHIEIMSRREVFAMIGRR